MQTSLLFIYTESPLHAGTGSGLSAVDLPIQRERSTQYPNIQGSGVKGALRSQANAAKDEVNAIFGPEAKNDGDHAGAVSIGEARILLFPIRSLAGVFAYATCQHVLARLQREAQHAEVPVSWAIPSLGDKSDCFVTSPSSITANNKVVLEEFSFTAKQDGEVNKIAAWVAANAFPVSDEYKYWREKVANSLVILPDDAFRDFVVNSTEVTTHVRILPDSKTVQGGALWTREALPADTLMFSAVTARRLRVSNGNRPQFFENGTSEEVLAWLGQNIPPRIQIGGDETTGAGQVALRWAHKENR